MAAIAGSEIKKVVLELGGSDPFIVMPSADLARAAQVGAVARCLNNGQSCIAAKRFIVHDAVYDEFARLFTEQMAAKTVGDPMLAGTDVGPLASEQQRDDVEDLVADAVANGAKLLCGGVVPDQPGFYYPPTVLAGITGEMRVHREEVFGPVATLYRVSGIDAAVELANGTTFGLGANAWTTDEAERSLVQPGPDGRAWSSSTATSPPTRSCRSGASSVPGTAGSSSPRASASSATSRPSGSAILRPPGVHPRPSEDGVAAATSAAWSCSSHDRGPRAARFPPGPGNVT